MEDRMIIGGRWRFVDVVGHTPLEVDYRILAAYAWVGEVEFEVVSTPPGGTAKSRKYAADERNADPWIYAVRFQPDPGTSVVVRLLIDGKAQFSEAVDLGVPLNTPQTRQITPRAPRLVRAVNTTPIGCPGYTADQDDPNAAIDTAQIETILNWIWKRLSGGLDPAWLGPDGGRGVSLDEMNLSAAERQTEEWARGFAELVLGSRYGGAESAWYFFSFNGDTTDGPSTERMAGRRDNENGRSWFPLGLACQQMATLGLMLSNYPYADFRPALNAGGSLGRPVFTTKGGHAYSPGATAGSPPKSVRTPRGGLNATPPVRPGTVYEFYDTPNGNGAHIGMLIRVHPDQNGWCGVQSIDTGGLNAPGRETPENYSDSNYDDPWLLNDDPAHGVKPFKGVGVPYPRSPLSLATVRTWWPLGFARLVLRRRSDSKLLYATPMLRMHHNSQGFPLGLYGWSLRCRPYAAAVDARWQITIPQRGLARTMVETGPDATVRQVLEAASAPVDHPERALSANAPTGGQWLFAFASVQVDAADRAHREPTKGVADGMHMPWGIRSCDASAPKLPDLTAVPPYLWGDEKPTGP